MWSGDWVSRTDEARARSRPRWSARTPNPRDAGECSRGDEGPGEHRPVDRTLARAAIRIRERTLEVSKAPKWAYRLPSPASPAVSETRHRKRPRQRDTCGVLATPGNRRPGLFSPVGLRVSCGERSARSGKGAVKPSGRAAPLGSLCEPTREKWPARAGTAPREGKALKGDSSGRERYGTRPRSVGASRQTAITQAL
jgi:hypothetical protein